MISLNGADAEENALPAEGGVAVTASRSFPAWLAEHKLSLAFTTYQAGKIFFIGLLKDGGVSVFQRSLERCMGLGGDAETLWTSAGYQLWRLENTVNTTGAEEFDRRYVPQMAYVTGEIDIHDIAIDSEGAPLFVSTLCSCLARPSETYSFAPVWKPSFVSRLAPEDRCHLNGLAMRNGKPAFVTALAVSDTARGWSQRRRDGGILIDVNSGEVALSGLSMPHSPRLQDGRVWLLNSGAGEFGYADLGSGRFVPVCFLPGFARGLTFVDGYAVIGLSRPRQNRTFEGLLLNERLTRKGVEPTCGLVVIDLKTGDAAHWVRIEGLVQELYDVLALPGVRRPAAVGFQTDEIRRLIRVGAWVSSKAQ